MGQGTPEAITAGEAMQGAARATLGGRFGRCRDPAAVLWSTVGVRVAFSCGVKLEGTREGPSPGGRQSAGRPYPEAGAVGVGPQQAEPIPGLELAADGEGDEGGVVPGDEVLGAEEQGRGAGVRAGRLPTPSPPPCPRPGPPSARVAPPSAPSPSAPGSRPAAAGCGTRPPLRGERGEPSRGGPHRGKGKGRGGAGRAQRLLTVVGRGAPVHELHQLLRRRLRGLLRALRRRLRAPPLRDISTPGRDPPGTPPLHPPIAPGRARPPPRACPPARSLATCMAAAAAPRPAAPPRAPPAGAEECAQAARECAPRTPHPAIRTLHPAPRQSAPCTLHPGPGPGKAGACQSQDRAVGAGWVEAGRRQEGLGWEPRGRDGLPRDGHPGVPQFWALGE